MHERPLTSFESRWLAEATRLREEAVGSLEDDAANRAARSAGGDLEARLCRRALALDVSRGGMRQRLVAWSQHSGWAGALLVALAALAGGSLGASVLGDGLRPVNVVWALGGLLGLNFLTLLAWCASFIWPHMGSGSLAGRLWLALTQWLGRRHGDAWLPEAGLSMARRGRVVPAWLGRLSHGLWLVTLLGALVSMVLMLSARQYDFVWETTILSQDVFVRLVEFLGAAPALLGLPMPDAEMVQHAAAPDAVAADRQVWSLWLMASLVLYGVIPRFLLWAWSTGRWMRFTRTFRLDLEAPGYARLASALMPASEGATITDADPGTLPAFTTRHTSPPTDGHREALCIELGPDLDWPPSGWSPSDPSGIRVGDRLDSGEQRRKTLDRLALHPPQRLLVAIDTRLSPDRGARALIAELSQYAEAFAIWLRADGSRLGLWQEALSDLGVPPDHQFSEDSNARRWLEAQHA